MASSSALKREIATAFADVNHPPLSADVLSSVAALSTSLRLPPPKLAEQWEAHSLNRNVEVLDDSTLAGYRAALSKVAGNSEQQSTSASKAHRNNSVVITNAGLGKRSRAAPGSNVTPSPAAKRVTIADARGTTTQQTTSAPSSSSSHHGSATTPAPAPHGAGKRQQDRNGLSAVDGLTTPSGSGRGALASPKPTGNNASGYITPLPSAPAAAQVVKYSERKNAGEVVSSYNPSNLPSIGKRADEQRATVVRHPLATHPVEEFRHMFTPLEARSKSLEDRLLRMSDGYRARYGLRDEDEEMVACMDGVEVKGEGGYATWTPVGLPKQNKVVCVGRICNEAHEGRLNRASIRLEGSRQHSAGSRIQLDLQGLLDPAVKKEGAAADVKEPQSYSFFPGQIVAVEGINSSGRTMQVSRLLEGVAPPPRDAVASKEEREGGVEGATTESSVGSGGEQRPLTIVSMCGPYTTNDNLDYDPLVDAMLKIAEDEPDVVVLCGPFVDGRQPLIASGEPVVADADGNDARGVSYEKLFALRVSELLEELYANNPDLRTQFVLVPSVDDAFLDAVYPQPPMVDRAVPGLRVPKDMAGEFGDLGLSHVELAGRESAPKERRPRRVHCVSNPCTLRVNDVTVGITSTDVLFHISSDECNANLAPGTRLSRIAQHLVKQRSYYPLFPAARGASLDLGRCEQWEMPVQPDVLIVPSRLASFARRVCDSTIAVNPGTLTKNATGGTYAVVDIHPAKEGGKVVKTEGGDGSQDEAIVKGFQDRVRVDIKRI